MDRYYIFLVFQLLRTPVVKSRPEPHTTQSFGSGWTRLGFTSSQHSKTYPVRDSVKSISPELSPVGESAVMETPRVTDVYPRAERA